ncbi:MAG: Crp/Fnr family transcriptional regulator [Chitinophagaceae bacterium]
MLEVFRKYIESKVALSDEGWALIESVCIIKKLRKQQFLLQEGDVWRYHAFVCQGCLRRYSIDDKGIEHILQFSLENWWAGDRESLINATPSRYNIDAIEDSTVLVIRNQDYERICRDVPVFNEMANNILARSFNAAQDRINTSISLDAEEKYLRLLQQFPDLVSRVPRHMIASYLGITPETLSRIKRKVTRK